MPHSEPDDEPGLPNTWGAMSTEELARLPRNTRDLIAHGVRRDSSLPCEHGVVIAGERISVTAQTIAEVLAERLGSIVPAPFELSARDGDLWVTFGNEPSVRLCLREIIDQPAGDLFANVETAIGHACADVAELVSLELRTDWPQTGAPLRIAVNAEGIDVFWSDGHARATELAAISWNEASGS